MTDSLNAQLQQAAQWIKAGRTQEAYALLRDILREHPDHAPAWYLASFVTSRPEQQVQALQKALAADPTFVQAQQRLNKLRASPLDEILGSPADPPSPVEPPFSPGAPPTVGQVVLSRLSNTQRLIAGGILAAVVLIVVVIAVLSGGKKSDKKTPDSQVFAVSPTPQEDAAASTPVIVGPPPTPTPQAATTPAGPAPLAVFPVDDIGPMAVSPTGDRIAVLSTRGFTTSLRLWNPDTGQPLTIPGAPDGQALPVNAFTLGFSPDGSVLALLGTEDVTLLDAHTGTPLKVIPGIQACSSPKFDAQGESLTVFSVSGASTNNCNSITTVQLKTGTTQVIPFASCTEAFSGWDFDAGFAHCVAVDNPVVKLWDTKLDTMIQQLPAPAGQPGNYARAFFSPGGTYLAAVFVDNTGQSTLQLWDPAGTTLLHTLALPPAVDTTTLTLTPDDRQVVSLDSEGYDSPQDIVFRDAASGQPIASIRLDSSLTAGSLNAVFSADGTHLAGQFSGKVAVWNVSEMTGAAPGPAPISPLLAEALGAGASFSANLAPLTPANAARLRLLHQMPATSAWISPDQRWLVADEYYQNPGMVWDLSTLSPVGQLDQPDTLFFTPDSTAILYRSKTDQSVQIWDITTRQRRAVLPQTGDTFNPTGSFTLSADGITAVVLASGDMVRVWSVSAPAQVAALQGPAGTKAVAASPDGSLVAALSDDSVVLWQIPAGTERARLPAANNLDQMIFSPGGTLLALLDYDAYSGYASQVIDTRSGQVLANNLFSLAWSSDGRSLALLPITDYSKHLSAQVMDLQTGQTVNFPFNGNPDFDLHYQGLAFSPDGQLVAVTATQMIPRGNAVDHYEVVVYGYDLVSGQWLPTLNFVQESNIQFHTPVFLPNSRTLLTMDGPALLWDVRTGQQVAKLAESGDSALYTPDGALIVIVSGAADQSGLFDAASGARLAALPPSGQGWWALDGKLLVLKQNDTLVFYGVNAAP